MRTNVRMGLASYRNKRDFDLTPEPGDTAAAAPEADARPDGGRQFVVHMHDATRLHYDLRLELDGVLKCWAVPKGPTYDPAVKRLAVHTEDHPLAYLSFEGVIPEGQYGGGPMLVWDRGLWFPDGDPNVAYAKGHLKFTLAGEKLRGQWNLVKTSQSWMLVKSKDASAHAEATPIVEARPRSVRTGRDIAAVLADGVARTLTDVVPAGAPEAIPKAVRAPLPKTFEPQLATAVTTTPTGTGWLAEVKLDGYRLVARKDGERVKLVTRGGLDWTRRFPGVARAVAALPAHTAVLDGEVVVFDARGRTDFGALQAAIEHDDARIVYVAFDLAYLDGWDLCAAPLIARKEALRLLLARVSGAAATAAIAPLRYGDHVEERAAEMHAEACALGLEGTVVKKADAPYHGGRSKTWLKVKCFLRQELVIVGFTDPKGGRDGIGALLLGVHDEGRLRYAGKVGTGFGAAMLRRLAAELRPLERASAAFTMGTSGARGAGKPVARPRGTHWVEPTRVAEVAFAAWTKDGLVRQASFVGLREDKPAREVTRERPIASDAAGARRPRAVTSIEGVRLTHPDKVMFPDLGITKQELAEYYAAMAPLIVPYVAERPLSLVRCPDGVRGQCFYQKHPRVGVPAAVPRRGEHLVIDSREALLALVHFGVVELHVWGARADALERPDLMVLDLDPAPDVPWSRVAKTALALRDQLAALGLGAFLRATGGKGLHVVTPLTRRGTSSWEAVKALSHGLARALAAADPQHYTAKLAKAVRAGKVFVDYLRNGREATAVASWSVRARDGAPVATPLAWDALDVRRGPPIASLREVLAMVGAPGWTDPWAGFEAARRPITRAQLDAVASLSSPAGPASRPSRPSPARSRAAP